MSLHTTERPFRSKSRAKLKARVGAPRETKTKTKQNQKEPTTDVFSRLHASQFASTERAQVHRDGRLYACLGWHRFAAVR